MKPKHWLATVAALAVAMIGFIGTIYLALKFTSLVNVILYMFLFAFGVAGIPLTIMLMSPSFPGVMRKAMGKFHFILGQSAFGTGYLVEYDDRYQMHPGRDGAVWIDGEYRELEGGQTNMNILGWRPFGLVRYKDEDTLQNLRADPRAEVQTSRADGGTTTTRAGYTEKPADSRVSGEDGEWLVDLKRVATSGVKKMGDIDVLEKAEEIVMRKESKASRTEGREALIGSIVGLFMGIITGYVLLGGV